MGLGNKGAEDVCDLNPPGHCGSHENFAVPREGDAPSKWTIRHLQTGEVVSVWPVDAREFVASGAWEITDRGQPSNS